MPRTVVTAYRAVSLKTTGLKSRGVLQIAFAKPKISQTCTYVSCTSSQGAHFHHWHLWVKPRHWGARNPISFDHFLCVYIGKAVFFQIWVFDHNCFIHSASPTKKRAFLNTREWYMGVDAISVVTSALTKIQILIFQNPRRLYFLSFSTKTFRRAWATASPLLGITPCCPSKLA